MIPSSKNAKCRCLTNLAILAHLFKHLLKSLVHRRGATNPDISGLTTSFRLNTLELILDRLSSPSVGARLRGAIFLQCIISELTRHLVAQLGHQLICNSLLGAHPDIEPEEEAITRRGAVDIFDGKMAAR